MDFLAIPIAHCTVDSCTIIWICGLLPLYSILLFCCVVYSSSTPSSPYTTIVNCCYVVVVPAPYLLTLYPCCNLSAARCWLFLLWFLFLTPRYIPHYLIITFLLLLIVIYLLAVTLWICAPGLRLVARCAFWFRFFFFFFILIVLLVPCYIILLDPGLVTLCSWILAASSQLDWLLLPIVHYIPLLLSVRLFIDPIHLFIDMPVHYWLFCICIVCILFLFWFYSSSVDCSFSVLLLALTKHYLHLFIVFPTFVRCRLVVTPLPCCCC